MLKQFLRVVNRSESNKSQSVCLLPIAGCLIKAEGVVGSEGEWLYVNEKQRRFLTEYYVTAKEQVRDLPDHESIASTDANVINQFLAERGFAIQLSPFAPLEFGVADVFKLLLEWVRPGAVTNIREGAFPAVRIDSSREFFASKHAQNPIVSITAKNGDVVRMTAFDGPPTGFDLAVLVKKINESLVGYNKFGGVVFPMIDYDEMIDISWMRSMQTVGTGGPWGISQALQQTKFRMNEKGAKVESAVAMGIRFMFCDGPPPPPDLIIDQPFLLWIERAGLSHPLFIAHFVEANWKKPAKL